MQIAINKTGKTGEKTYVAKITGLSTQYGFARMFCELIRQDGGSRKLWTEATRELQDGLYEIAEMGDRDYRLIWSVDGVAKSCTVSAERAARIAELLDGGHSFESARLATKSSPVA